MPEVTIPIGNVRTPTGAVSQLVTGSEQVDAGRFVRFNTTSQKYQKANKSSADDAGITGVAITTCEGDNKTFYMLTGPYLELSAAFFTQGVTYYISTDGRIMLESDLVANDWIARCGVAETTTKLVMDMNALGFQKT